MVSALFPAKRERMSVSSQLFSFVAVLLKKRLKKGHSFNKATEEAAFKKEKR
jgi:hypothetical protein